jgi:hypothetical protein
MKNTLLKNLFILFCFIICQKIYAQNENKITFMLKITELENPGTVSLLGPIRPWGVYNAINKTQMQGPDAYGYYTVSVAVPDSLNGQVLKYTFRSESNKTDIRREFLYENTVPKILTDLWGYLDGFGKMVKPFQEMLVRQTNTPDEAAVLAKPYFGVTFDGKKQDNLFPIKKTGQSTEGVRKAVLNFINSLSPSQKAKCTFPIDSDEWRKWHNIELYKRTGIGLEELSKSQNDLAMAILEAGLSPKGVRKSKDVMNMEAYLALLTPTNKLLGGQKYWFTFMGTPSETEPWGFQYDGHHLIINYFVLGDQVVMSPTFMGSEPNVIPKGPNKGTCTYEAEEKKGLVLFNSLNAVQKEKAQVWHNLDQDFNRTEAFRDNEILAKQGIPASELNKGQKEILLDLIKEFVGNIEDGHAKIKMAEVKKYINVTNFSWVQTDGQNDLYYYRIHSPVILIEFDHQVPVSIWDRAKPRPGPVKYHIHTVVRTPNGNDYGKDLLREHLTLEHVH